MRIHATFLFMALLTLVACSSPTDGDTPSQASAVTPPATAPTGNLLRMTIDGVEWQADSNIWGTTQVPGYPNALMASGSKGPKDANEQAFNLNLYGISGAGTYVVSYDNPQAGVAQLANLSPERFLAGGLVQDFNISVEVLRAQTNPIDIEVRFHGTLTANDSSVLQVEDGHFRYRE